MNTSTRSHDALAVMQEQQTAKALYGATESRLCRYYAEAARRPGLVGGNPLQVLERRFNNVASHAVHLGETIRPTEAATRILIVIKALAA